MSLHSRSEDDLEPMQWGDVVDMFRDIGAGSAIAFSIIGGILALCVFLSGVN